MYCMKRWVIYIHYLLWVEIKCLCVVAFRIDRLGNFGLKKLGGLIFLCVNFGNKSGFLNHVENMIFYQWKIYDENI